MAILPPQKCARFFFVGGHFGGHLGVILGVILAPKKKSGTPSCIIWAAGPSMGALIINGAARGGDGSSMGQPGEATGHQWGSPGRPPGSAVVGGMAPHGYMGHLGEGAVSHRQWQPLSCD